MGDNIMTYNGGSVIAMTGKNCVAIATDLRFGIRNMTVGFDFPKVYKITDHCLVGLPGLLSDSQTLYEKLKYRVNLYGLRENREIKASTFANMCQSVLYERRFGPYFVEPVIAGLEDGKPYLCAMDLIGAPLKTDDFVLAGTAAQAMFGLAETLWKPDLSEDELFEVISQVILNSLDRDALAGWGARVYILTTDRLITKDLRARQD